MQARRLTDPASKRAFDQAISRVRAISSVHERLYRTDDPLVVDMGDYLDGLCADLARNSEMRDQLQVAVESIQLKTERAIPVALIVNELVTNALKYAYPEGAAGPIVLSLKTGDGGMLELSVADDGIGYSGESVAQGLGYRLVRTMAAQIDGEVVFRSVARGHHVSVLFPEDDLP